MRRFPRPRSTAIAILFGALVTVAVLALILGFLPDQMVLESPTAEEIERSRAVNEIRRTMAQIVGGVVVIVGGGVTAWLTLRRVNALEQQVALQVQGDITERLSRGIEQLGASSEAGPSPEIRAGAVFTLERVAVESETSFEPVFHILMGYVRTHSPRVPDDESPAQARERLRMDVDAAMASLERLATHPSADGIRVVLPQTHYPSAALRGRELAGANFGGASIDGADLREANLPGSNFIGASLRATILTAANLEGAYLVGADLGGTNLDRANLAGAYLVQATLINASLVGADLTGAFLNGSNLRGADLRRADLTGARIQETEIERVVHDEATVWPDGFEPPPSAAPSRRMIPGGGAP